jgi:hypothetical protein
MDPRQLVVAVLCLGAVGLQAWTVGQLRADVAALRAEVAGLGGGPAAAASSSSRVAPRPELVVGTKPVASAGEAAASGDAEGVVVEQGELEALVHRTLEQQSKERAAAATAKWISWATDHTEGVLSKLVEDGSLDAAHSEPILTILVNEMHDGAQLKVEVEEERMDGESARAAWDDLRAENDAALADLLGEDGVALVREAVESRK